MAVREDLKDVNNGQYNNVLLFLALGVLLYIVARGWQQTVQESTSDSIGSDKTLMIAQQLRQAFIPLGFPVGMGFDGTDVPAVMSLAAQITDYEAVAKAYRTLYNADLSNDLSEELSIADLAKFWNLVNAKKTTTGSTTTSGTTTTGNTGTTKATTGTGVVVTVGTETRVTSLVNKTAVATQAVNMRLYKEPAYAGDTAAKGDKVGTYAGEADLTINGVKGRFAHIKKAAVWGLYDVDYWVHKGSLTFL
ncbi:hypothetical protein [Spirosoma litoris]